MWDFVFPLDRRVGLRVPRLLTGVWDFVFPVFFYPVVWELLLPLFFYWRVGFHVHRFRLPK